LIIIDQFIENRSLFCHNVVVATKWAILRNEEKKPITRTGFYFFYLVTFVKTKRLY